MTEITEQQDPQWDQDRLLKENGPYDETLEETGYRILNSLQAALIAAEEQAKHWAWAHREERVLREEAEQQLFELASKLAVNALRMNDEEQQSRPWRYDSEK